MFPFLPWLVATLANGACGAFFYGPLMGKAFYQAAFPDRKYPPKEGSTDGLVYAVVGNMVVNAIFGTGGLMLSAIQVEVVSLNNINSSFLSRIMVPCRTDSIGNNRHSRCCWFCNPSRHS